MGLCGLSEIAEHLRLRLPILGGVSELESGSASDLATHSSTYAVVERKRTDRVEI